MPSSDVQHRVAHFIERSGKKKSEIARLCDVTPGAVTQWINGSCGLSNANLALFCEAVGITRAEFWGLERGDGGGAAA
jgi:transcriptional regulator with XRE-family HTH domain